MTLTMWITTGTGEAKNRAFCGVMAAPPVSSGGPRRAGDHGISAEEDQGGGHGPRSRWAVEALARRFLVLCRHPARSSAIT